MLFAIPALICVGFSWALTGVVMSDAPRRKCDPALLLLVSSVLCGIISLICWAILRNDALSLRVMLAAGACYFIGAAVNYCMLQLMSRAMQKGPNGVIWSFIQAALIFPFLTGVVFFNNKLTVWRLLGLILLLLALVLLGAGKDNTVKGKGWKKPTAAAFFMAGLTLSLNSLPSYYPEARLLNSMGRTFFASVGSLAAAFFYCYPKYRSRPAAEILVELKRPIFWKY